MKYTIHQLAELAGVSTRTLRYYDQIKLLPSPRADQSGYRIYSEKEVDTLQQILFFKELGFELGAIAEIMGNSSFDYLAAMEVHLLTLKQKEVQLHSLIRTVERTIQKEKGEIMMTDQEKFEGFKNKLIAENEEKYGAEIREKYGEEMIDESNRKMMNMSKEDYDRMTDLSGQISRKLSEAVQNGADYKGEAGREVAMLHREWLSFTWPQYSGAAHHGLVEMYLADERFKAHYDQEVEGCAQFIRDAVCWHIGQEDCRGTGKGPK